MAEAAPAPRKYATANGACRVVELVDDLPAVDGIIIATPATTHAELLDGLLGREVPIFTEKPFTTDVAQARRLAAHAPNQIFVMDVWRYHPGIKALRGIAESGELGTVQMLRSTRANWTSSRQDTDSTWTLLPHDLSIALEILGCIPTPRFAVAENLAGRPVGMTALLGEAPLAVLEVSNRHPDKRREVRLHCEQGVAILRNGDADHIEVARESKSAGAHAPSVQRRPYQREPALRIELRTFVEHLRGGPPPKSSAAEGLAVVEAITQLRTLAGLS